MGVTQENAEKVGLMFDLSAGEMDLLMEPPYRGSLPTQVPTDPLV